MKRLDPRHVKGDCELLLKGNKLCAERAGVTMTRTDGTTQLLCLRHANRIKRQMAEHPESYAPVRFVQITPSLQLTKYDDA